MKKNETLIVLLGLSALAIALAAGSREASAQIDDSTIEEQ